MELGPAVCVGLYEGYCDEGFCVSSSVEACEVEPEGNGRRQPRRKPVPYEPAQSRVKEWVCVDEDAGRRRDYPDPVVNLTGPDVVVAAVKQGCGGQKRCIRLHNQSRIKELAC